MNYIDYQHHFHHPANNFSNGDYWGDQSEFAFGNRFAEQLSQIYDSDVIAFRELPVPGTGIADFVIVNLTASGKSNRKTTIQSFELKLKDWRSGLMQAHRYKYFSNAAILVIPSEKTKTAQASIGLFKQLNVGLWSFNTASGTISKKFTPRPRKIPDNKRAAYILDKALDHGMNT